MKIRKLAMFLFSLISLAGCSALPVVQMSSAVIPSNDHIKFVDERTSPSAGPYMFVEGNVYSCHYAITKTKAGAMHPGRLVMLHSYLDNQVFRGPQLHTAIIKRFDIYWNRHLVKETEAFGPVGESISSSGYVIGCKGVQEGEYYKAEVPGPNYTAIVIYLDSAIDGRKYDVRTVYPMLEASDPKSVWPDALSAAINQTFAALGSMIAADQDPTNKTHTSSRMNAEGVPWRGGAA